MFLTKSQAAVIAGTSLTACAAAIVCQSPIQAQSLSEKLSLLSEIKNQSLPMMVDPDIRVDSTYVGPGKLFGYKYTMVNHSATRIDGREFAKMIRPEVVKELCYDPSARYFRDNNVSIGVKFYDRNRNLFSRIKVSPAECR